MEIHNTFGRAISELARNKPHAPNAEPFGQQVSEMAKTKSASMTETLPVTDAPPVENMESPAVSVRQTQNQAILEASLEVSLSIGNEPLALVYKTALEQINSVLEPMFGPNALQKAYDEGLDVSPEATANRIVSQSTAFFSQYLERNPDMDLETALSEFTNLIGGAIDKGFSEARDILGNLKVLDGDIGNNIDRTYELVQEGLRAFVKNYPRPEAVPPTPPATGSTDPNASVDSTTLKVQPPAVAQD